MKVSKVVPKESKILTKEFLGGIQITKAQINAAINQLSINRENASSLNDAISVIDKLLEANEERVLNFDEILILESLMAFPLISSGSRYLEARIEDYFNANRNLINEILPNREENAQVSFLSSCFKDCLGGNEKESDVQTKMTGQHKDFGGNNDDGIA
jgi:hypothetical protein